MGVKLVQTHTKWVNTACNYAIDVAINALIKKLQGDFCIYLMYPLENANIQIPQELRKVYSKISGGKEMAGTISGILPLQFPINPSKIQIESPTGNNTVNLVNAGDITLTRLPKQFTISWNAWFPRGDWFPALQQSTLAKLEAKLMSPSLWRTVIQGIRESKLPVRLIIPNMSINAEVTIETFNWDYHDGAYEDCYYNISFKEYVKYSIQKIGNETPEQYVEQDTVDENQKVIEETKKEEEIPEEATKTNGSSTEYTPVDKQTTNNPSDLGTNNSTQLTLDPSSPTVGSTIVLDKEGIPAGMSDAVTGKSLSVAGQDTEGHYLLSSKSVSTVYKDVNDEGKVVLLYKNDNPEYITLKTEAPKDAPMPWLKTAASKLKSFFTSTTYDENRGMTEEASSGLSDEDVYDRSTYFDGILETVGDLKEQATESIRQGWEAE